MSEEIVSIDHYMSIHRKVTNFEEFCESVGLILDKEYHSCNSNGSSKLIFAVSNEGGMFYHFIETIEEMESFHNAFALGQEYQSLKLAEQKPTEEA